MKASAHEHGQDRRMHRRACSPVCVGTPRGGRGFYRPSSILTAVQYVDSFRPAAVIVVAPFGSAEA
jgi:hypothetical protein